MDGTTTDKLNRTYWRDSQWTDRAVFQHGSPPGPQRSTRQRPKHQEEHSKETIRQPYAATHFNDEVGGPQ